MLCLVARANIAENQPSALHLREDDEASMPMPITVKLV